jgi:hypothetical protein
MGDILIVRMLSELLVNHLTFQRVMTHLEIERIARETGESFEQARDRVQVLAETAQEQVKSQIREQYNLPDVE